MGQRAKPLNKVDAVVVGSGASGSLLAAKLAQAGKAVTIREAGRSIGMGDLISSQIWARRLKYNGPTVETGGADPIGHNFNSGWGTGGGALHHYAVWLRLHPDDFALHSRFGVGLDWPLSYDELRPAYDQIQAEVGISGDARAEVWRPAGDPYPMGPVPQFKQGTVLRDGFEALGLRTSPLPLAINTEVYKGRPACLYDGWCDAGCPIGALANPLAVYLPQALAAGATLCNDSSVGRVLTDAAGTRATGVEFYDAQGTSWVQEADLVILAAFVVENPRILLNSATSAHPNGLANASGLVGAYLMTHISRGVFGLWAEETEPYMGPTGGQLLCQDDYAKDPKKGYVGSYGWLGAQAVKPDDLLGIAGTRPDIFGPKLHDFMREASQHLGTMTLIGENQASVANRVTLSTTKDRFGLPLATLNHAFAKNDVALWEAASEQGKRVFVAGGAKEVWLGAKAGLHLMGGTVMGADPATSVANGYGQTHELPNLFAIGPGLFPSSGAVNPTYTVHALTRRTADYLTANWTSFV